MSGGAEATTTDTTDEAALPDAPAEIAERRLGRALLFVQLLLSPLILSTATLETFEYPKVTLLLTTSLLLAGGALALAARRRVLDEPIGWAVPGWQGLRRDPVAAGVVLFLLSALLSTASSLSPVTSLYGAHASYAGLLTLASYAVLFFATRALCSQPGDFLRLQTATAVASALVSGYALVQLAGLDPVRWTQQVYEQGFWRVASTLGNTTLLAGFLVTSVPAVVLLCWRALRAGRRAAGVAWGLVALASVGVTLATLTRGAWLALAVVLPALGLAWARVSGRPDARRKVLMAGAAALVLAGIGLATAPSGRAMVGAAVGRARALSGPARDEPRLHIWRGAIEMFRDRPILGAGVDVFQVAFQRYRSADYWRVEAHITPTRAHSEPLHVLATQGLVGGAAALVLIGGLAVSFRRALRRQAEVDLVLAAGIGTLGFLVLNLFSFTVAATGTLFVTYAALLSRLGQDDAAPAPPPPAAGAERLPAARAAQAAAWGACALALYVLVLVPVRANVRCQRGVPFILSQPLRALPDLQASVALDATKDIHWTHLGMAEQQAAHVATDPGDARAHMQEAKAAFQRALDLIPVNAYHHMNLGRVLAELARGGLAQPQEAGAHFDTALELDPRNPYLYAEAAHAALSFGQAALVRSLAARCLAVAPRFGPCAWQIANLSLEEAVASRGREDPEQSRQRFETAAAQLRDAVRADWPRDREGLAGAASQLSAALVMTGRLDEALVEAQRAVTLAPRYADGRFNLARIYERLRQPDRAREEYRRILEIQPDHREARAALGALEGRPGPPSSLR